MKSIDLQRTLINSTVKNSGHDQRRAYIGLSSIGDCEQIIFDRYFQGTPATIAAHLKTAISYDLEAVLINRLSLVNLYIPARNIELYDGLVQGHPDGEAAGDLLEIKTIERDEWIPEPHHLPNRIFFQIQAYMHFGGYQRAHVIYLARDTGALRVIGATHSPEFGLRIEAKISRLVTAVRQVQRPACSCGHCPPELHHVPQG